MLKNIWSGKLCKGGKFHLYLVNYKDYLQGSDSPTFYEQLSHAQIPKRQKTQMT